jgi:hypothetical protein
MPPPMGRPRVGHRGEGRQEPLPQAFTVHASSFSSYADNRKTLFGTDLARGRRRRGVIGCRHESE